MAEKFTVHFDESSLGWLLTWGKITYHMRLSKGQLLNDFFGPTRDYAPEDATKPRSSMAPFNDPLFTSRSEASVRLAPDGRQVLWNLANWRQLDANRLVVELDGSNAPLHLELSFSVDDETGVLRRGAVLTGPTANAKPIDIGGATSLSTLVPPDVRQAVYLSGKWGAETQVRNIDLGYAPLLLESRAGKTGFEYAPYLALLSADTTYVYQVLWSGNWQLHARRLANGWILVSGGLSDWGFRHRLCPGETLTLPDVLVICSEGDLNRATQRLHDYHRKAVLPDPERLRPVQLNSWYPCPGEPHVDRMKKFADVAAATGCETFVLDAGWYTTEVEDTSEDWITRTGDWVVNRKLFPRGLEELSAYCQNLGLGFGIWFEPESVSPNSVVRREHPEWLHHVGGQISPVDKRSILHLGVPEARAFVRDRILNILKTTGATWMKWDFNTSIFQGGWSPDLPETLTRRDPIMAHYEGVYWLQDELRAALPNLTLEMCAGGGGRFDAALLSHAHTNWMSDQTNALQNLAIHFGSHLEHTPIACNDWLIEWPPQTHFDTVVDRRGDLAFRTRIAMLGTFGVSAPVDDWTENDIQVVKTHIDWYKRLVRPVIQLGDQYFLTEAPPLDGKGDWASAWYASKDRQRGVLFVFRLEGAQETRSFPLPGLDPNGQYALQTPEGRAWRESGEALARGLSVTLDSHYQSTLVAVSCVG